MPTMDLRSSLPGFEDLAIGQLPPHGDGTMSRMHRITTLMANEVDSRVGPLKLTKAQWRPMLRLLLTEDTTVAALARGCNLNAGAMTRLLDRLEVKNLCRRVRSAEDRRVVHLELTDEGRSAARKIPAVLHEVQIHCGTGLHRAGV